MQKTVRLCLMREFGAVVFLLGLVLVVWIAPVLAATTRLQRDMVVDPLTGVALGGFDPITYFTDSEPVAGRTDFEIIWKDVPWYFSSEGNMEVFRRAPEVYAPQFGAHGVMGLARGFLSDGNPLIYKVLDNRLYLFYSFSNRAAFELVDKTARLEALRNWTRLTGTGVAASEGPSRPTN